MVKKSTTEIRQKAIKLYLNGLSAAEIGRILEFGEASVRRWLKDENMEIKCGGFYNRKYNKDLIKKISELYRSGMYAYEIDEKLGLRKGASQALLNQNNIEMRHRGPKSKIKNEKFFDEIDNEFKAYFLGFIVADGNVSIYDGQYSLKIHIAYRDKDIIDKFIDCIESTNKAKRKINQNGNESYYVSLTSIHMCKRLIELGVIPNKTGKEKIPRGITKEFLRHFLRGFFDGDGITDINKKRSGFVSSIEMIESIQKELEIDLTTFLAGPNKKVSYFLGGKKFSKKLYKYLYEDANIYLERKKNRLENIIK